MSASSPQRVLIAKPGLDGHDVGAKIVCRALMEAGVEVVYTGLRRSPEAIAEAAVTEDVDVVGLSILSGAHEPLTANVIAALDGAGGPRPEVIVGGNIPAGDREALVALGVSEVFPTSTPLATIVEFVRTRGKA